MYRSQTFTLSHCPPAGSPTQGLLAPYAGLKLENGVQLQAKAFFQALGGSLAPYMGTKLAHWPQSRSQSLHVGPTPPPIVGSE